MGVFKLALKGWQGMLQIVLPWASEHPGLFIFSCGFWLFLAFLGVVAIAGWPW